MILQKVSMSFGSYSHALLFTVNFDIFKSIATKTLLVP